MLFFPFPPQASLSDWPILRPFGPRHKSSTNSPPPGFLVYLTLLLPSRSLWRLPVFPWDTDLPRVTPLFFMDEATPLSTMAFVLPVRLSCFACIGTVQILFAPLRTCFHQFPCRLCCLESGNLVSSGIQYEVVGEMGFFRKVFRGHSPKNCLTGHVILFPSTPIPLSFKRDLSSALTKASFRLQSLLPCPDVPLADLLQRVHFLGLSLPFSEGTLPFLAAALKVSFVDSSCYSIHR